MTKILYYSEQAITPTFADILRGAKEYAYGDAEVEFEKVGEPGPGVLCFGAGFFGYLLPTMKVLTMSADGLSLLVRGLKLAGGTITPPPRHAARVIESVAELDALGDKIVVDIETKGDIDGPRGDLELLCIGIWDGSQKPVMVVPAHLCRGQALSEFLSTRGIICHNSAFDIAVLNALLGTRLRPLADTMVLHYAMHPASKSHGLKDLARYYLGVDDWEHDIKEHLGRGKDYSKIPTDVLYRYCALDVYYTGHLLGALTEEATEESKRFYWQRMEDNNFLIELEEGPGVFIDIPYFERLLSNMQADLDAGRSVMAGIVGRADFNPASPQQVKGYLHEAGFEVKSTEAKELEKFAGDPFIDALLKYKSDLKMRGFVKSFLEKQRDGYLHPQFKIARTTTGRLASSNINIQQIPREGPIKKGIIAPPGYKVVTADYSQVELRVMAVLSGDKEMQSRFQPDSPDFFDALMPAAFPDLFPTLADYEAYKAEHGGTDKKYRAVIKGCVPLTTKILTQRGWLSHDEVRVGDKTPGLVQNGVTEWATIQAVHHWDSKPVYRLGHAKWNVEVTDNHRWAVANTDAIYRKGDFSFEMLETKDIELKKSTLLVAGRVEDADRTDLTLDEVEIISWVASDGHLKISPLTYRTSQGHDGRRRQFLATIQQAKPQYVQQIRDLLDRNNVPYTEDTRPGVNYETAHNFRLTSEYARELFTRAGLVEEDYVSFVLSLGTGQRQRFLDTFCAAEGYQDPSGAWLIGQNYGNKQDAVHIAATLLGYRPSVIKQTEKYAKIRLNTVPYVGLTTGKREYLRDEPVWCVTTENGTWTAYDGEKMFVTGNCVYGLSFGRGANAIGQSIGQDGTYAQKIIDNIFAAYPQWGQWREGIKRDAVAGTLEALTGMPFEAEIIHWRNRAELERSGLSFMPQHHANQLMLNGAKKMHANLNGRGWIHAVVHDAAYLYVKEEHAGDVACELEAALVESGREFFGDAVLFAAGPEIGDTWEEV